MNAVKKTNYHKTKIACYMGFITQAIAANFAPLLFLKFHSDYHISLGNIALISTFFFFTQLLVDLFCAKFVDHIGYRVCIVASEIFAALGPVSYTHLMTISTFIFEKQTALTFRDQEQKGKCRLLFEDESGYSHCYCRHRSVSRCLFLSAVVHLP